MKQNIEFEYKVRQGETGLSHAVMVYSIGEKAIELSSALAFPSVGVGLISRRTEDGTKIVEDIRGVVELRLKRTDYNPISLNKEQDLLSDHEKLNWDVIQTDNMGNFDALVNHHFENYQRQFGGLASEFADRFKQFIEENQQYFAKMEEPLVET